MAADPRDTARELEQAAAEGAVPTSEPPPVPVHDEALAMLARRGFHVTPARLDLPFDPAALAPGAAERITAALRHYAFRLFLRGAIKHAGAAGFAPEEATHFLGAAHARRLADSLVELGLAEPCDGAGRGRFRLTHPPHSFGSMLEWYVGRELHDRLGFAVAVGVKFHAPGVGGDLDVVAAAEGRLVYLELKSSPPKHLSKAEVAAFFDRVRALRPDVTLFVVDTALRLGDRVLPMLDDELRGRARVPPPPSRRVERELWALTPHLYAVNARPDLIANVARAIAEGFLALGPDLP